MKEERRPSETDEDGEAGAANRRDFLRGSLRHFQLVVGSSLALGAHASAGGQTCGPFFEDSACAIPSPTGGVETDDDCGQWNIFSNPIQYSSHFKDDDCTQSAGYSVHSDADCLTSSVVGGTASHRDNDCGVASDNSQPGSGQMFSDGHCTQKVGVSDLGTDLFAADGACGGLEVGTGTLMEDAACNLNWYGGVKHGDADCELIDPVTGEDSVDHNLNN